MKTSTVLLFKKLATFIIIAGISVVSFSCGDDEKYDCDSGEDKIDDLFTDYYNAVDDEDCDEMESLSEKIIAEIKKAKSCEFVKDAIDDSGSDDLDELLDDIQSGFDSDADFVGC